MLILFPLPTCFSYLIVYLPRFCTDELVPKRLDILFIFLSFDLHNDLSCSHQSYLCKTKFANGLSSIIFTCKYLEFLESGPFKYIIPSNSNYFRYIENSLLIYPQELVLVKIT